MSCQKESSFAIVEQYPEDASSDISESSRAADAEKAVEIMFDNCDPEKSGYASVTSLINFMTIQGNCDLHTLQPLIKLLDPMDIDPNIERSKFYSIMRQWYQTQLQHNVNNYSTPHRKFSDRKHLDELNTSSKSTYSCGSTPSPAQPTPIDRSLDYQKEIEKLKFQLRKQYEQIEELKSQLVQSEEVNASLHGDITKLTKKLAVEHDQNIIIQKLRQECEEYRESETNYRTNIEQLNKKCKNLVNENAKLVDDYEDAKTEIQNLVGDIDKYQKKEEKHVLLLKDARNTIMELEKDCHEYQGYKKDVEEKLYEYAEKVRLLEETVNCLRTRQEKKSRSYIPLRRKKLARPKNGNSTLPSLNNQHVISITNTPTKPFHSSPFTINSPFLTDSLIDKPLTPIAQLTHCLSPIKFNLPRSIFSLRSTLHTLEPILSRHNARSPTYAPFPNIDTNDQNIEYDHHNSSGDSREDSPYFCTMEGESSPENSGPSLLSEMVGASMDYMKEDHVRCSNEIKILEVKLSTLEEAHISNQLQYTNEIKTLEGKLLSLEEANNELRTQLAARETSGLNHERCANEIRTLEEQVSAREEANKELQTLLTNRDISLSKYKEQYNESLSLVNNLTSNQRTLEMQLETYNHHNQVLTETLDSREEEIKNFQIHIDYQDLQLNKYEEEITNLKLLLDSKTKKLDTEMRIKSQISSSLELEASRLRSIIEKNTELKQKYEECVENSKVRELEFINLTAELSEKNRLIAEWEIKHKNDVAKLKKSVTEVEELENQLKLKENELDMLEKKLKNEKIIHDKLVMKIQGFSLSLKGEKKLNELEEKLKDYDEMKEKLMYLEILEERNRNAEVRLLDYDILKRRIADLEEIETEHKQCPLIKDTIDMLNTVVEEKRIKIETLELKIENLENQLESTEKNMEQSENERIQSLRVKSKTSINNIKYLSKRNRNDRIIEKLESDLDIEQAKTAELITERCLLKNRISQLELVAFKNESIGKQNTQLRGEVDKMKSYLEETGNSLLEIRRQAYAVLATKYFVQLNWEQECGDVVNINKTHYVEKHFITFHEILCNCVYLLLVVTNTNTLVSHVAVQVNLQDNNRETQRCKRLVGISKSNVHMPTNKLIPNECTHSISTPSFPPKLKSGSQSPDSPSTFITPDRTMAEPCTLQRINHMEDNKILKNINNNRMSPDCPSMLIADINSNSIKADNSSNVGVINVADVVAESKEIFARNSWSELGRTSRRLSSMSMSATSTNSGSTESLNYENDHQQTNIETRLQKDTNIDHAQISQIQNRKLSRNETDEEKDMEVFPSIPDSFLANVDCNPDSVDLDDDDDFKLDDVEQKYLALSFAFNVDANTVQLRKERLQRNRDQTERNLKYEIDQVMRLVHRLNPLCIDAERTELVTNLVAQINIFAEAAMFASRSAFNYGAVIQEWRLNKAVQLMLKYVDNIKLQRDTAKRRFQYTSRMLQESTGSVPEKPTTPVKVHTPAVNNNNRLMTRRRASIATISRPNLSIDTSIRSSPYRRPPSSNSIEASPPQRLELPERTPLRTARPSRSELGVVDELQKIGEHLETESTDNESEAEISKPTERKDEPVANEIEVEQQPDDRFLRLCLYTCNLMRQQFGDSLHTSGLFYELCFIAALVFFFVAIVQLGSILLEIEYARVGIPTSQIPWSWCSWDEILDILAENGLITTTVREYINNIEKK